MITIHPAKPQNDQTVEAFTSNGHSIGEFVCLEDGYYVWWPLPGRGYLPPGFLRQVADKLDELNTAWDTRVQADLARFS